MWSIVCSRLYLDAISIQFFKPVGILRFGSVRATCLAILTSSIWSLL